MIGEHIRAMKNGRWLHAIDCGDETVLHLPDDAVQHRVRRIYRPEFLIGTDAVEVVIHRERTFPPDEIVARAYSRAADPGLAAVFKDSEAFAEWCATGRLSTGARNVALSTPGVAPGAPAAPAMPPRPAKRAPPKPAAKVQAKAAKATARPAARKRPAKARPAALPGRARKASAKPAAPRKRPVVRGKSVARRPSRKTRR